MTTWNQAYDHGLAQGMTEAEATAYADEQVAPKTLLGVVEPPETQAEHREKRREMYEGLHALPTRLGMLPGYTKEKP